MNFSSILSEIERIDPEIYERTSPRRTLIKNWTRKASLVALPFAIGSLFNKAYGKTNNAVSDTLQAALIFELLEVSLYGKAIQATKVNPPAAQLIPSTTGMEYQAIEMIWNQEQAHVNFLASILRQMGVTPNLQQNFDLTGGSGSGSGQFAQVLTDYGTFLAVAQMLEDTGVRAYKGQMASLQEDHDILASAMRIHSMEARHAAHIRMMRSQTPGPLADGQDIRPWITLKQSGINSGATQSAYDGEENTSQMNIEVVNIAGFDIPDVSASQAFDEPLDMTAALSVINPFLAP
ncbi:MAG: ferritin-like domain-containing protein [Bacteroidetes bacterium]|nr:ferritin-like domain-containing protein [Bacteroidota bacterium]